MSKQFCIAALTLCLLAAFSITTFAQDIHPTKEELEEARRKNKAFLEKLDSSTV